MKTSFFVFLSLLVFLEPKMIFSQKDSSKNIQSQLLKSSELQSLSINKVTKLNFKNHPDFNRLNSLNSFDLYKELNKLPSELNVNFETIGLIGALIQSKV